MRLTGHLAPREEAQELMWEAMDLIHRDEAQAARFCRKAIEHYPDCTDALTMLAEIETEYVRDYVVRMREAVKAGRRDLGPKFFEKNRGHFWGLIETRPFMRAMEMLSQGLIEWGTPQALDEAITIQEEMLQLNPDDNQGVRDWLAGCYLARKRYDDTSALFTRYPDDWLAAPAWARVLLACVVGEEERAQDLLAEARERNPHVEKYLTGRKRLPKTRAGTYSPGDESEAEYCAGILLEAWKKHPKARKWLKKVTQSGGRVADRDNRDAPKAPSSDDGGVDAEADRQPDRDLPVLMRGVPKARTELLADLIGLVDAFCSRHLNGEYRELCRQLASSICRKTVPVHRGKREGWAAGVVYVIGRVNFLSDPAQTPYMKSEDVARGFRVSMSTMHAKARKIEDALKIMPLDPEWTLPSMIDTNPLVWMLEMDGFIMDVRQASREVQAAAYEEGLIPYIPADRPADREG